MKFYPPLNLTVFVGDITALVKGRNKEVAEMAKKASDRQSLGMVRKRKQQDGRVVRFLGERVASIQ